MKDEVKAVDEFLEGLDKEGDKPFTEVVDDPLNLGEVKETKEAVAEEEVKEDKPLPFHKDPKVQRFIEKEVAKRVSEVKPQEQPIIEKTDDEITDVLTRVIGNDTPEKLSAVKDLRRVILEREDKGAEKALQIIQKRQEEERDAELKAQEELAQGFEDIEETFDVDLTSNTPTAKKTKAEFVDFITKIAPKNEDGQVIAFPDLNAAFETFQERKRPVTQPNNRAKELSARSMTRSADASTQPTTGKSWKDVDRLFDKLSGN